MQTHVLLGYKDFGFGCSTLGLVPTDEEPENRQRGVSKIGLRRGDLETISPASRRLNALAKLLKRRVRYLEIGLAHGFTFEAVRAHTKVGVDRHPKFSLIDLPTRFAVEVATSDDFFLITEEYLTSST